MTNRGPLRYKMDSNLLDKVARTISSPAGKVRTAGKIEFIRDQGPLRRDIRSNDFEWSPDAYKNLAKILWAAQRAHSYAVSSLRLFSKMPSSEFSPDGLLGGRGYIQSVKELRKSLAQASEVLSSFTDTLYDEINASHWEDSETEDSKHLLENTEEVKEDPEAFVEEEYKSEGDDDLFSSPQDMNPSPEDFGEVSEEEESSDSGEESPAFTQQASDISPSRLEKFTAALDSIVRSHKNRIAGGNSSLPVSTLPGPRVEHVGPAESEYGWENGPEATPSDDPSMLGFMTGPYPIYEDPDVSPDGVTGYDNPTDADAVSIKLSSDHGYSWLPGSENLKIMPIYDRNLTQQDIEWIVANSKPENPINRADDKRRLDTGWIWKDV